MTARNPHEAYNRLLKVQSLCRAIRSEVEVPRESLVSLATFLRAQSDAWWHELSRRHAIRRPSGFTIEAVCLSFEADAEELGAAVESAFDHLDDAAVDERWER